MAHGKNSNDVIISFSRKFLLYIFAKFFMLTRTNRTFSFVTLSMHFSFSRLFSLAHSLPFFFVSSFLLAWHFHIWKMNVKWTSATWSVPFNFQLNKVDSLVLKYGNKPMHTNSHTHTAHKHRSYNSDGKNGRKIDQHRNSFAIIICIKTNQRIYTTTRTEKCKACIKAAHPPGQCNTKAMVTLFGSNRTLRTYKKPCRILLHILPTFGRNVSVIV